MILYLDASALVKRYVAETGSIEVNEAIVEAELTGTAIITRAEVTAALAKSVRVGALTAEDALAALRVFKNEWFDLVRVQVTELLIAKAEMLAWEYQLRGYDAIQLAAALVWQEAMGVTVMMAAFDQRLWAAARQVGLTPYPKNLAALQKVS